MNKLGFYIEVSTRQWIPEALVEAKPPTILWHAGDRGKLQEIRNWRSPDSFIIGRMFLTNQEQDAMLDSADPAAAGRSLADQILNYDMGYATERVNGRLLIDAWMSLNEPIPGPASSDFKSKPAEVQKRLRAYEAFQVGFRERLQTKNLEAVAFNFAAGNFTQASHYLDWFPRTLETFKYLGFHEYGWPALKPGPDVASGALLYRTCMEGIRQKYGNRHEVIITECGLARMYKYAVDPPGDVGWLWSGETISQDKYWESLAWYNAEMCRDAYVKGACLYQVGHGGGKWETFRHLGVDNQGQSIQIISRMAKLRDQPAQPVQPVQPPVQATPPTQPPAPPAAPLPTDLAGLKQRAAALETKLAPAVQQLAPLAQLATQKPLLDAAARQVAQAADALKAITALQVRVQQVQTQLAQRSDATPALRQRVADLQTGLAALQGRVKAVADLAPAVAQTQQDLQKAVAGLGNVPALQKQTADLLAAIKKLRADLDKGLISGDEISLQNPAPGIRVIQRFGQNPADYKPGFAGHEGIDYTCAIGTSILAAADGVVFRSGATAGIFGPNKDQGAYGIRVIVEHTWGNQKGYTIYAHLSSVAVQVGDRVNAGAVVGKSGNTGRSTGPHLHFSLVLVGKQNPGYKSALANDAWYHDPAPFMTGSRDAGDWIDDWFDGDMDDGEAIVCLPPGEFDEI